MSLHARCQQRIAITSAQHTVWRQRCVRYFASETATDPEWFQEIRSELLSRRATSHREELDPLHHAQLRATLTGSVPAALYRRASPGFDVSLAEVLTRFNARVPSQHLLDDGTDPLQHPGSPWMRRMWAGGAVKISPRVKQAGAFVQMQTVSCLELVKDVRLQGSGDAAKIVVTVERRFRRTRANAPQPAPATNAESAISDDDWGDVMVKEERNLVFMKARPAELTGDQALAAPRYLKAIDDPDYSFPMTPTRHLLFRYSAMTFNAHLIHLDPTYARDIEGHRNVLVHGALTLTLMLQALAKHLTSLQKGPDAEAITSFEYRNLTPLYCDDQMRVCVKKKKQTDTGHSWDVWVEGPTGGMAVKGVAHTAGRERTNDAHKGSDAIPQEDKRESDTSRPRSVVRKVGNVTIRRTDVSLKETAKRRAHAKRAGEAGKKKESSPAGETKEANASSEEQDRGP